MTTGFGTGYLLKERSSLFLPDMKDDGIVSQEGSTTCTGVCHGEKVVVWHDAHTKWMECYEHSHFNSQTFSWPCFFLILSFRHNPS